MIIVVSNIQLRRGKQEELPGAPTSVDPLTFSAGLDNSEMGFAVDTGRAFIGHTPSTGDVNYRRTTFPYQNLEVLTEASPRIKELFGDFARDQGELEFFPPTTVSSAQTALGPITYPTYEGTVFPTRFAGQVSAAVEYHAFTASGTPIKQGILKIIGTSVYDAEAVEATGFENKLVFGDLSGGDVTCANTTGENVTLYMRRTVIAGI